MLRIAGFHAFQGCVGRTFRRILGKSRGQGATWRSSMGLGFSMSLPGTAAIAKRLFN